MVLTMILSFFSTNVFASGSDIKGHWAEKEISEWVEKGLIGGYKNGSFKPDASISRAEFIALVNRAFKFTESSETGFNDVSSKDWYYSEVLKAKAAGYISGYQDGTIKPKNYINRQEVAAILSRLLEIENSESGVEQFKDKDSFPQWSKGVVGGIVAQGLMKGFNDGTFKPLNNTTRAEAVVILNRALNGIDQTVSEKVYDTAGTYGPADGLETVKGNVVITASDVTLRNMVIEGDLTITEEVGNGEVYLKGATVKGKTYVNGGGENSIYFEDTVLLTVIVNKADGTVRIVATGSTTVQEVTLQSSAKVEQDGTEGVAFKAVTLSEALPKDSKVTLIGNFETVDIQATTVAVEVPRGSIQDLNVDEKAKDTNINLAKDAKVVSLVLEAAVKVLGEGKIEKASGSKANESSYENKPNNVTTGKTSGGGGGGSSNSGGSSGNSDTTAPTFKAEDAYVTEDGVVVIPYSENIFPVTDLNDLKNKIQIARYYETSFSSLEEDDVVMIGEEDHSNRLIIILSNPLTGDKTKIKVLGNAIKDAAGNVQRSEMITGALKGAKEPGIGDKEDTEAPTIISLSPENGAKNVSLLRDWVITFDEDVTAVEEKFITINPVDEDVVVTATSEDIEDSEEKIDIPVSSDYVVVSGKVVTIKLWNYLRDQVYVDEEEDEDEYEALSSETEFAMISESEQTEDEVDDPYSSKVYITIQEGAFKDKAGNEFVGINNNFTWSFSVAYNPLTPIEISTAFEDEGNIDEKYSMDGGNVSLPVEWTKVEDAGSYMILLTDPDAGNFVHWIVKDIPKDITSIGEGVSRTDDMVGVELKNSYPPFYAPNDRGYGGPQPNIKHEYLLEVFALKDESFDVAGDSNPMIIQEAIESAMAEGKILGYGAISGIFGPEIDGTTSIISSSTSDFIPVNSEFTFDVQVFNTKGNPVRGLVYSDEMWQYDFDFKLEEYVYLDVISVVESDETPGLYTVTATHGAEEEIEITAYVKGVPITSGNLSFKIIGNPPSVNKIVLTSKDNIIDVDGSDELVIEFSEELSDESKNAILQYLTEQGIGIEAENKWDTWYLKQLWIKNTVESDAQFTIPKNLVYDDSGNSPAEDIVIKIPIKTLSLNGISISSFTDTNPTAGLISGIIEFTKAEDESIVTDYTIYISDRDTEGKWIKDLANYNVKAKNIPTYHVTIDNLDVSDASTIRIEVQPNNGEIYNWYKFSEVTDNAIVTVPMVDGEASTTHMTTHDSILVDTEFTFNVEVRDDTEAHNLVGGFEQNDFDFGLNDTANGDLLIESIVETDIGVYQVTATYNIAEAIEITVYVKDIQITSGIIIVNVIGEGDEDEGEPDTTAPKATSITVDETGLKILVVFDEPIVLHDSLSNDMFTVKVDKAEEFYIIPVIDYKETENQNEMELTLEEPIKVGFDVNIGFNGEGSLSDTTIPPNFVETTLGLGYVTNNSNVGVPTDQN